MAEEIKQRETCDFVLFTITPQMTGVFSIAEAVDDSNKRPEKTVFCYLTEPIIEGTKALHFNKHQTKSLDAVGKMVEENGGKWCKDLKEVAEYLNTSTEEKGDETCNQK